MRKSRGRLPAFTLIDLLVVMAVFAILVGVLSPALAVVRQRDMRTACLNQLKKTAMGMNSYCTDFEQYFPSWTGYGGPTASYNYTTTWEPFDDGWYKDPRTGHKVSMIGGGNFSTTEPPPKPWGEVWMYNTPIGKHRTIYSGRSGPSRTVKTGGNGGTTRPAGQLNMAPVGLGYLVEGGYVADARVFFCPSAREQMPPDYLRSAYDFRTAHAATKLSDLRRAGGFDHKALAYGDWQWLDFFGGGFNGIAVQGTYHYRNTPLAIVRRGGSTTYQMPVGKCYMAYTKPAVRAEAGCPPFKTQKLLGGRALVSDTFTWHNLDRRATDGTWPDKPVISARRPGYAVYHHRDGYNVLYGDWSARWYADPAEEIMWPTWVKDINDACNWRSRDNNYLFAWRSLDGKHWKHDYCSHTTWNKFDMAVGIDVHSTKPGPYNQPPETH